MLMVLIAKVSQRRVNFLFFIVMCRCWRLYISFYVELLG